MSEQSMNAEAAMSPQARAAMYLEMKQAGRIQNIVKEKDIKTPVVPEKVKRTGPLMDSVIAYEQMIDTMGEKGYVGAQKALERLRPDAYTGLKVFQWGTRAADFATTALLIFAPRVISDHLPHPSTPGEAAINIPFTKKVLFPVIPPTVGTRGGGTAEFFTRSGTGRILSVLGMVRFRPVEWLGGKAVQLGGRILTSDMVAPVVNAILGGGERVQPEKPKPLPFSGAAPAKI